MILLPIPITMICLEGYFSLGFYFHYEDTLIPLTFFTQDETPDSTPDNTLVGTSRDSTKALSSTPIHTEKIGNMPSSTEMQAKFFLN